MLVWGMGAPARRIMSSYAFFRPFMALRTANEKTSAVNMNRHIEKRTVIPTILAKIPSWRTAHAPGINATQNNTTAIFVDSIGLVILRVRVASSPMGNRSIILPRAMSATLQAIEKKEVIGVFGDYDADGIPATALLSSILEETFKLKVFVYIPSRNEGYGLNKQGIDYFKKKWS